MASEDNPANSGLDKDNPLYEAATGKEGEGDQVGDGKYVDEKDDSGGGGSGGSSDDDGTGSGGGSSGGSRSNDPLERARNLTEETKERAESSGDSDDDSSGGASEDDRQPSRSNDPLERARDLTEETRERAESESSELPTTEKERAEAGYASDEFGEELPENPEDMKLTTGENRPGQGPDGTRTIDGEEVSAAAAREAELEALSSLNESTGGEGQAFKRDDIELETRQEDGQTIVAAQLEDSGQDKLAEERDRIAEDELFSSVQEQTQADLDRADVRINERDGEFRAELTEEGKIEEAAASSDEFGEDDLLVDSSGDVFVSTEARKERIAADNPGVQPDDITIQETRGSDGDIESDVSLDAEATAQQNSRDGDVLSGAVSGIEGGLSEVAQVASGDQDTSVEFRGEGSVINQARQDQAGAADDRFGDTDLTLPFTDIEVGEASAAGAQAFDERIATPVGQVAGDVADVSQSGIENSVALFSGQTDNFDADSQADIERVQDIGRGEDADVSSERGLERFSEGAATGAVNVANVPAVANTGIEAGEFAIEGAEQTAAGRGGEFAGAAGSAGVLLGARTATAAKRNPARFGGQVAGSTIASGASISAASRLGGSGAGRATAAAIQPGEELAIAAARRGVPNRVATKIPGVTENQIIAESSGGSGRPLQDIDLEGSGSTAVESIDFRGTDATSARGRISDRVRTFIDDESGQVGGGQRQRTRQRQRQEQEPVIEIDVENDPLVRGRQRTESAQESSVRADAGPDVRTRLDIDSRLRSAQRLETTASQTATEATSVAQTPIVGAGLGSDISATTTPAAGLDIRSEPITEPTGVVDTRTGSITESRQDLRVESRSETRTEARAEARSKTRLESDIEPQLSDEEELTEPTGASGDTATKRFEYGIATPEEVLEGGDDIGL